MAKQQKTPLEELMEDELLADEVVTETSPAQETLELYPSGPSVEAVEASKLLKGNISSVLDGVPPDVVDEMIWFNLAADAGDGGVVRGYRWHQYNL